MIAAFVLALALAPAPAEASRAIEPAAAEPVEAPTDEVPTPETPASPTPATDETTAPAEPAEEPVETVRAKVSAGNKQAHAPYYDASDAAKLRKRYRISEDIPAPRTARWRCFIADPVCGFNVEVNATSAFAGRFKQGDVRDRNARKWASGRAQYDVWVNIPVLVETLGSQRYTRMTLGPKAGVAFSDTGDTWGNLGIAMRYWLGRGRWAPTIELTSALSFKIAHRETEDLAPGAKPKYEMQRGPVGIAGDIGFGFGGFGAIVVGGQYDSPLAREDVPDRFRTSASGMLFVGFRGNILWGGPAAAAVLTHGLTQRYGRAPN